jgi:hypothetical protein
MNRQVFDVGKFTESMKTSSAENRKDPLNKSLKTQTKPVLSTKQAKLSKPSE